MLKIMEIRNVLLLRTNLAKTVGKCHTYTVVSFGVESHMKKILAENFH